MGGKTLVSRQRQRAAVDIHLCIHKREGDPRVGAGYKLAIKLQVHACGMAGSGVIAIVDHLHVAYRVRDEVVEELVIRLCREAIGSVVDFEAVVHATDDVDSPLALHLVVERGYGHAVHG